jgi:opacity protein-like surface antigen
MKGAISAAIATACVTASAAVAADMPIKAAPPVSVVVNDWSGFYLGAHGGYGWGHEDFRQDTGGTTIAGTALNLPNVTLTGLNSKGWVGGFQAGYNWQHTQWVGGLEIDL